MNMHEFDDIIKQKATQREADITPDIWEGINQKKKKRRIPFFWLITIGFLLGGSAIVWNIVSNNKPELNTSTIEKVDTKENNINSKSNEEKNETPAGRSNHLDNNDITKSIKQSSISADLLPNVVADMHPALNKTENPEGENGKHVSADNKKQPLLVSNETNGENNEKVFSAVRNKKKIGGSARLNILAGEIDEITDVTAKETEKFPFSAKKLNKNASAKTTINDSEKDSLPGKDETIASADEHLDKPATSLKVKINDSLVTKRAQPAIADSATDQKLVTITKIKDEIKNKKKSTLKIEAGFALVSAVERYNQPLFLKRVIDKPGVRSTFISNNIKTTMETGSGFSVSVVKSLNKKGSVGAGVQYVRITERLQFTGIESHDNYSLVQRLVTDPNGNFLKTDTVSSITRDNTTLTGRNVYSNVSIPLFVRYQLANGKKWSASLTAGIYVDLMRKYSNRLPGKYETVYAYGTESQSSETNMGFDAFAGVHFAGKIYKKYEWFAEPSFRYDLSGYKANILSFNKKINKPGITIGMARRF